MNMLALINSAKEQERQDLYESLRRVIERAATAPCEDRAMEASLAEIRALPDAKQIIFSLRKALSLPYYEKNKYNEQNSAIHLLHELAIASFIDAPVFQSYRKIGDALAKATEEAGPEKRTFADFYRQSRKVAKRAGIIENDLTPSYLVKYFSLAVGSLVSMHWFQWIRKLFHLGAYDPHGALCNTSGAFFEEEFESASSQYSMRAFITATPTIGDALSPEAHALLQGLENRSKMSPTALAQETFPYTRWIYTNLQNMASPDEGVRSKAILEAQNRYTVFRPISLACDSPLYLHPDAHTPCDEKFLERVITSLIHPANFSSEDRIGVDDVGYFFPDPEWLDVLPKIAKRAWTLVAKQSGGSARARKIALHELIHLGIIRYHILHNLEGGTLFSCACKEGMDRGGAKNGLILWAFSPDIPERDCFAWWHGRPLLARYRLPRRRRLELVLKTMELIPKQELKQFLHDMEAESALYSKRMRIIGIS